MSPGDSFGALLKRFRIAGGLTHETLAERSGLGARTISDLERGVSRAPRADTLALLVGALNLSSEDRSQLETSARAGSNVASPPSLTSSNLTVDLTSFVGREREVRTVGAMLKRDARLVTLTGPGGGRKDASGDARGVGAPGRLH